ncbi:MAG TPA: phage portal protein, partial [Ktedonobacterales bacterium]
AVWGTSTDDSSDDDKMALMQELATNGAITGNAFLKINAQIDLETGLLLDPDDYPELVVLDSRHVRVRTDPHNVKLVTCYIIEYPMPDPARPQDEPGMFRQVIERKDADDTGTEAEAEEASDADATWEITEYFRAHNAKTFTLTKAATVWPFSWAPIDGCAHLVRPNRYYGCPRLTPDVIHLNEAICLVTSNINKVSISHSHPVLFTVTPGSNLKALKYEPGTIMQVPSKVEAVQAHGDLANMMAYEKDLRGDLDQVSHIPAQAFGRQDVIPRTAVSGVAIRLGYGSLLSDITKERRTYGALDRRISQRLLCLKNPAWADAQVELSWQDPLPADDLQQAQVLQTLLAAGVMSKREAASNLGYDWDKMQDEITEEGAAKVNGMAQGTVVPQPPSAPQPGQPARQRLGQSPIAQPGGTLPTMK